MRINNLFCFCLLFVSVFSSSCFSMKKTRPKTVCKKRWAREQREASREFRALSEKIYDAIKGGDVELVEGLLEKGVSRNALRKCVHCFGFLPRAARYGHVQIVSLLLKRGAKTDDGDIWSGNTALHCVFSERKTDDLSGQHIENIKKIIWLFKQYGANFNALNYRGHTPYDFAAFFGYDVLEMLKKLGAHPAKSLIVKCSPKLVLVKEESEESEEGEEGGFLQ